ncbi:hypothetical protein [Streptomyces sp. NPDC058451]
MLKLVLEVTVPGIAVANTVRSRRVAATPERIESVGPGAAVATDP